MALSSAKMEDAILEAATAGDTVFCDVNLGATKELKSVIHRGPSTIGLDTICRSRGKTPESLPALPGVPRTSSRT
jgi:hypothetical protein